MQNATGLTDKQARFVDEFLIDLNATAAAKRAGYAEASARQSGYRMLQDEQIADAIAEAQERRARKLGIKAERVLEELERLAFADVTEAFDDAGGLLPIKQIPKKIRRAIKSIEIAELFEGQGAERTAVGITRKVQFNDKLKALELFGKHLGMWNTDSTKRNGADGSAEAAITPPIAPSEYLAILKARQLAKTVQT